jgi:hypothetical protein
MFFGPRSAGGTQLTSGHTVPFPNWDNACCRQVQFKKTLSFQSKTNRPLSVSAKARAKVAVPGESELGAHKFQSAKHL